MNLRNRLARLCRLLPASSNPDAPLSGADLGFLDNLNFVYGDGGAVDWRERFPTRRHFDEHFDSALKSVYGEREGER